MSSEAEGHFLGLIWNCVDRDAGVYCPFYNDWPNCPVACDVKYIDDGWDTLVEGRKKNLVPGHCEDS